MLSQIAKLKHQTQALVEYLRCKGITDTVQKSWFKNKSVVIVGGAGTFSSEINGDLIDSFDIVVRINNGVRSITMQKDMVGRRTDFLFHCAFVQSGNPGSSEIDITLWKKHRVGRLIFPRNYFSDGHALRNIRYFFHATGYKERISIPSRGITKKVASIVHPAGPTTGFSAIEIIRSCQPRKIFITGFTFWRTGSNDSPRNLEINHAVKKFVNKHHDFDKEFRYVKSLWQSSSNVEVDKRLEKIFLEEDDNFFRVRSILTNGLQQR